MGSRVLTAALQQGMAGSRPRRLHDSLPCSGAAVSHRKENTSRKEKSPYHFCMIISTLGPLRSAALRDPCSRDEVQPYPGIVLIPPNRPGPGRSEASVGEAWGTSAVQETRDRCHCGSSNWCDLARVPHSSKLRSSGETEEGEGRAWRRGPARARTEDRIGQRSRRVREDGAGPGKIKTHDQRESSQERMPQGETGWRRGRGQGGRAFSSQGEGEWRVE